MTEILKAVKPAILIFITMTILCGVVYTGAVTGLAQALFPKQANGSIITVTDDDGTKKDVGSELVAQEFTGANYLIGRPMRKTNFSPVSREQEQLVQERIVWWHSFDPENNEDIPMDLVTASGSGIDPYISPEAADFQVERIAKTRGISEDKVRKIIQQYTTNRFLGFIGEPGVNVLRVNLALDGL